MRLSRIQSHGTVRIISRDSEIIGELSAIHVANGTDTAIFVQVLRGGEHEGQLIIPITRASITGDDIRVPYDRKRVSKGPRVSKDALLTLGEAKETLKHYSERGWIIADRHQATGKKGSPADVDPERSVPVRNLPPRVIPKPSYVGSGDLQ